MITTIIFDFYGIFQADPYEQWLSDNALTRTGEYRNAAQRLDSGEISRNEFINELNTSLKRRISAEEIYVSRPLDQSIIELAELLHKDYKLGLLSNASVELRSKLEENSLIKLFDEITISSEAGVAKPDPRIYKLALERLDSTPPETFYIDDNPDYVLTAREVGIQAIQYISIEKLKQDLSNLSII